MLRLGHVHGEGNPWADAESRGHTDVFATLRSQLAIEPISLVVPEAALTLLDLVRAEVRGRPLHDDERQRGLEFGDTRASGDIVGRARPLSADDRGNAKKRKSSAMDDGPGKSDHLFGPPTVPGARLGASATTAPAPSPVAVAAPPASGVSMPPPPAPPHATHAFDQFAHLFPTPPIPGALSVQTSATVTHEQRPVSSVPAASATHSFTEVPGTEARSKAAARIRLMTTAAHQRSLTDVVKNDTSAYAIRPRDPASLGALLADMG